tara:strand:- start:83 stop:343 length:261 start_codon:yes stop_codon:yes gene_type:complete
MCDCKEVKELPSLKIYTYMGTYKAKLNKGASVKNGVTIFWETATQEELAYAYEELGMTGAIEKISNTKTKDESKKSKRSSKNIDKE